MTTGELLRAGSWIGQDGGAALLKTASDVLMQVATLQHPKVSKLAEEACGAGEAGKTNSVDSSSTAARGGAHLLDTGTLLPPLRQISLDVIQATELGRGAGVYRQGSERHNIFQDVFNELAGKDELAPLQAGTLYTLPSMQFLESMLSDFEGSRAGAAASAPGAPGPLDLPADAFDLPDTWGPSTSAPAVQQGDSGSGTGALRPTPFDQSLALQQQAAAAAAMIHQRAGAAPSGHRDSTSSYSGFVPMGSSASAPVALAPAAPAHSGVSGMSAGMSVALPIPRAHTATYPTQLAVDPRLQQQQLLALQQQQAARMLAAAQAASQPVRGPAAPQPKNTPRRQSHAYADFDYEEPEVSLQTSKSGRVRKVASFTGVKRRLDVAASESRDSRGSMGADATSGEVGSKGSKGKKAGTGARGRKGRRTVCLNCGCTQTPQWRCGPLGPRTLCNACGVRYKKDLPLNCWPIRDGMVLPPGAVLPPGFVCPPGITIHTQPADFGDL